MCSIEHFVVRLCLITMAPSRIFLRKEGLEGGGCVCTHKQVILQWQFVV